MPPTTFTQKSTQQCRTKTSGGPMERMKTQNDYFHVSFVHNFSIFNLIALDFKSIAFFVFCSCYINCFFIYCFNLKFQTKSIQIIAMNIIHTNFCFGFYSNNKYFSDGHCILFPTDKSFSRHDQNDTVCR